MYAHDCDSPLSASTYNPSATHGRVHQSPMPSSKLSQSPKHRSRSSSNGLATVQRVSDLAATARQPRNSKGRNYAPIPRTSTERLSQPDVYPECFPSEPVPASALPPSEARTVLYFAYGSNLNADVFQGRRQVKPISSMSVSAPSLSLTFSVAGIPYLEPCFANVAPRKLPKPPIPIPNPPKVPPKIPDLPNPPSVRPPRWLSSGEPRAPGSDRVQRNAAGDPVWNSGLIGVVYEVTKEDYAKIIATEGGGAGYQDVLVPCLPLPPTARVPETPPIPELPRPFLAHILYLPLLPDLPDDEDTTRLETSKDGDDDGDEPEKPHPKLPSWLRKLMLPAQRPDPSYAQASARYLGLIADGAREHDLPGDYQEYLEALIPYQITTRRQSIGRVLFNAAWVLPFALLMLLGQTFNDKKTGRAPVWLMAVSNILFNLIWLSYDKIGKVLFGDGERTQEAGETTAGRIQLENNEKSSRAAWLPCRRICDEEQSNASIVTSPR